ncbi:MAG: nicotinate-nucleotide adenylyltransferase [Anaerovoracaceae bacterium]
MKKIGVLGGTFDPIHRGHISLAHDAMDQGGLDEVIFMPAKLQPFKTNEEVTPAEDRIAMLRLATEYVHGLTVSTIEMDMEGLSYTYLSLRKIRKALGEDHEIYFISGTDTYLKMGMWKEAEKLLTENAFIVGERPGYKSEELQECMKLYKDTYGTKTIVINNKRLDISATDIRKRMRQGERIGDLVPEGVERYIYDHELYR